MPDTLLNPNKMPEGRIYFGTGAVTSCGMCCSIHIIFSPFHYSVFIHVGRCKLTPSGTHLNRITERRYKMETRKTTLISLLLIILMAFALTAPTSAQADRGHGHRHHHHGHHHHHHYSGGYNYIYSQPRGYYRPYYPQPQYYYPAPVYAPPPQMMMGINTGNVDFMIRF